MKHVSLKYLVLTVICFLFCNQQVIAGPPFSTDDPQPVDFKHWEYYISTMNTFRTELSSGTSPHFEINYGLVPNIQVHLIMPVNYDYSRQQGFKAGYANTEIGIKYRFVKETDIMPQIGTFPIVEIPTIGNNELSNGYAQLFIPLWAQKSWGKLTTYGGGGYWINPGTNTKNWIFAGWEVQYDFSASLTLGGELYFHTPDTVGSHQVSGFNLGGSYNASNLFHIIFSVGHSIIQEKFTTTYFGLLWTI